MVENCIPNLAKEDDNDFLCKLPLAEEIKGAVFDLNGDGAPDPDGFGRFFLPTFLEYCG